MNTIVAIVLLLMMFLLGFSIGGLAHIEKIRKLIDDCETLNLWLKTSQDVNKQLLEMNEELINELEKAKSGENNTHSDTTEPNRT